MLLLLKRRFFSLQHRWPWTILDILFIPFEFLFPTTFKLFGFPIFWRWAYLMMVIPETRRAYSLWLSYTESTKWRLFPKRAVRTKFNIYVFIIFIYRYYKECLPVVTMLYLTKTIPETRCVH